MYVLQILEDYQNVKQDTSKIQMLKWEKKTNSKTMVLKENEKKVIKIGIFVMWTLNIC